LSQDSTRTEAQSSKTDTRSNLLDAAEMLFAEHGIPGASLRAITSQAGVNLAAAHYHFGSKEGLVRAVLARHMGPINQARLSLLDAAIAEAGAAGPELEALVRAFITPILAFGRDQPDRGRAFARIFGRAFTSPDPTLRTLLRAELKEIIQRFLAAFQHALPQLSHGELMWRIHFTVGSMAHTMVGANMLKEITGDPDLTAKPEQTLDFLVQFLTAGLAAPPAHIAEPKP
jgi:AcrR family transcriptional regulator